MRPLTREVSLAECHTAWLCSGVTAAVSAIGRTRCRADPSVHAAPVFLAHDADPLDFVPGDGHRRRCCGGGSVRPTALSLRKASDLKLRAIQTGMVAIHNRLRDTSRAAAPGRGPASRRNRRDDAGKNRKTTRPRATVGEGDALATRGSITSLKGAPIGARGSRSSCAS